MEIMLTTQEYLKRYPNASLDEYCEYVENYKLLKLKNEHKLEEDYNNWLKDQEGKWFLINFNDTSYVLSKYIGKSPNAVHHKSICFSKDFKYDTYGIRFETDRYINYLWLNELNPCSKAHLPGHLQHSSIVWAKPVSNEVKDKIFTLCNKMVQPLVKQITEEIESL